MSSSLTTGNTNQPLITGGPYTDLKQLVQLRYAIRELDISTSDKTRNPLSGLLTSNFRGRGIDFAEVRSYQPGDDVRSIDWRVTARTGKAHTKLFQEEKEKPVLLLVDQGSSMFFGSRQAFKSVVAAQCAALTAWSALEAGDRVGGIVFADDDHIEIRPRRSKHSVLRLISELNRFNHGLGKRERVSRVHSYLEQALRNVRRVAKHGSAIVVISDFMDLSEAAIVHLRQLSRHNDIVGIMVTDPLEKDLPRPDLYTISDGQRHARINTASAQHRRNYHDSFIGRKQQLEQEFKRMRAACFEMSTADTLIDTLASHYREFRRLNLIRGGRG